MRNRSCVRSHVDGVVGDSMRLVSGPLCINAEAKNGGEIEPNTFIQKCFLLFNVFGQLLQAALVAVTRLTNGLNFRLPALSARHRYYSVIILDHQSCSKVPSQPAP